MHLRAIALTVGVLLSATAHAVPITYAYQGANFNFFEGSAVPPGVTALSGFFTADLDPGIPFFFAPISAWSFSDGHTTIESTNTDYFAFDGLFATDDLGAVTAANIEIVWNPFDASHPIPSGTLLDISFGIGNLGQGSAVRYCFGRQCASMAFAGTNDPGSLTIATSVPEPGTLSLLVGGLLLLAWRTRRAIA